MTIAASAPLDGNVKPLALTMGDPAGIGGDITLKAWQGHRSTLPPFFVIDDPARLEALSRALNLNVPIAPIDGAEDAASKFTDALPVYKIKLKTKPIPGTPDPTNASSVISAIETAVRLVQNGDASAVVTNPIHKESLYGAGFGFPGHTEFLASLSGIDTPPVMMLVCSGLRVVPVTVHLGLREAIETLDADSIITQALITHNALIKDFNISRPRIAIAGLNPHAGEGGTMGTEEIDQICPAIKRLQADGVDAFGPVPPDTLFTSQARGGYDAALCMYHDQALIPIKTLDFDRAVNVTLGLPFVRTSPDHGTAFDIAGTGKASESSLVAALNLAADLTRNRTRAKAA